MLERRGSYAGLLWFHMRSLGAVRLMNVEKTGEAG